MRLIALTGEPPEVATKVRRTRTFQQLGLFASRVGLDLVVATPAQWHYGTRRIQGWKYVPQQEGGTWRRMTVPMTESVVYDAMYLADLKQHQNIYHKWKRFMASESIPFFNPVLPAKDVVYRNLGPMTPQSGHLPATQYDVKVKDVLAMARERQNLWLKPTYGSGGRNMLFIQSLHNHHFRVIAERFYGRKLRREMAEHELRKVVSYALRRRSYMAQEHISMLHTPDGRKFDLRVTVQRNQSGGWQVVALTGRFGSPGSILTNFHAGGRVVSLTGKSQEQLLFVNNLGMSADDLERAAQFALLVARRLQNHYSSLGLLGLDIGQSATGEQFVYDFNGRPGRDILTNSEVTTAMSCVAGYGKYLGMSLGVYSLSKF